MAGGKQRPDIGQIEVSNRLILMTDKFAPSERRNDSEIMSAPTQVGVRGMGTLRSGPHSRWTESGPDFTAEKKRRECLLITTPRRD
jgi:hypothetical protein